MFSAGESNCWIDPVLLRNMDSWEEGEGGVHYTLPGPSTEKEICQRKGKLWVCWWKEGMWVCVFKRMVAVNKKGRKRNFGGPLRKMFIHKYPFSKNSMFEYFILFYKYHSKNLYYSQMLCQSHIDENVCRL